MTYKSEQINELATALAKAQVEFSVAGLNKNNPFFKSKYADFKSIVEASRPALSANNISVTQCILPDSDGNNMLLSILMHSSGQYIESRMKIAPAKTDIQSISSYITYVKRLAYTALVGVLTGDEDDDGEAAVAHERAYPSKTSYPPSDIPQPLITPEQLEELHHVLRDHPDITMLVLDGLKINSLNQMPRNSYLKSVNRVRELVGEKIKKNN